MTNLNEYLSIEDLKEGFGLATTHEEATEILNTASDMGYAYYVGTNLGSWLKEFDYITDEDLEELEERVQLFELERHDNSYNWGGHSNTDIDFKILSDDFDNSYAYVAVHIGTDIRGGYTKGILLDLGYTTDAVYTFLEGAYDADGNTIPMVEVDGAEWSASGDVLSEEIRIYNHDTDDEFIIYDSIYTDDINEARKDLTSIIEAHLSE